MVILLIYGWGGKLRERGWKVQRWENIFSFSGTHHLYVHTAVLEDDGNGYKKQQRANERINQGQRRKHWDFMTESEDYGASHIRWWKDDDGRMEAEVNQLYFLLYPTLQQQKQLKHDLLRFKSHCARISFSSCTISFPSSSSSSALLHATSMLASWTIPCESQKILHSPLLIADLAVTASYGKKEGRRALSTTREVSISTRIP